MPKRPAVYIVSSGENGTLYTGVTSNLIRRVYEHREGILAGFSKKHKCKDLVFFEDHSDMLSAIKREKQIKLSSRKKKLSLIEDTNPSWDDLYEMLL